MEVAELEKFGFEIRLLTSRLGKGLSHLVFRGVEDKLRGKDRGPLT